MRAYLEKKALYVKNDNNLVYKTATVETWDGYNSLHVGLELVAGQIDGEWQPAKEFDEEVQTETVIQYYMEESMRECLESESYEILDESQVSSILSNLEVTNETN